MVAFLVAGCGGQEPIPVNLETAAGPCEHGAPFLTEGMEMVMRDGQLTVAPKEGQKQAFYATCTKTSCNGTMDTGCSGCH